MRHVKREQDPDDSYYPGLIALSIIFRISRKLAVCAVMSGAECWLTAGHPQQAFFGDDLVLEHNSFQKRALLV